MKTILAVLLTVLLLLPVSALGEIQTVTHTVKQPFGGSQSPDDARISAIAKAKREALEMAGTYIESLTVVKNYQVDKDEILALAAGVLKAEVVSQENYHTKDAFGIDVVVKVVVDTSVLEGRVKKLLQDRTHLEQLNQARKKEKELLDKVASLEVENRKLTAKNQGTQQLKKEFQQASRGLTAMDWLYKAGALRADGKYTDTKKAIEYLNNAIKLQPDLTQAYRQRGLAYARDLGQHQRAIEDFNKAIRLQPDNAADYTNRGLAYRILGQHQRALEDYNEAIRLKPDNAIAYNNRGFVYRKLGQHQRAIEDYNEAIRLQPDNAVDYANRGLAYCNIGQHQRAIEDYNEAIRLQPDNAKTYNNRGVAYNYLGQYKKAMDDFDEAIRLRPNDSDSHYTYYNYACSFSLQKDTTQACIWLGRAIERGFKDWKHLDADKDFDNIRNEKCFVDILKKNIQSEKKTESTVNAGQQYKAMKGIVLINGNIIEGQIISMNADIVKIRTKEGKVLSYDFKKEVQRFITE